MESLTLNNVAFWPNDSRYAIRISMGMLLFAILFSLSAAAYSIFTDVPAHDTWLPIELWRWVTTVLLGLIVWVLKRGYSTVVHKFTELGEKMDDMGIRQQAFIVAVVQITMETHPDKAEEVMERFAPLLQAYNRSRDK